MTMAFRKRVGAPGKASVETRRRLADRIILRRQIAAAAKQDVPADRPLLAERKTEKPVFDFLELLKKPEDSVDGPRDATVGSATSGLLEGIVPKLAIADTPSESVDS